MNAFYTIEENQVYLNATKWFDKRLITTLPEKNQDALLGHLQDKYSELDKEVTLLLAEYKNAPDKLKFAGKINRQKSYIATAKAIGDFNNLLQPLDEIENEIKTIVDDNVNQRKKIVADAQLLLEGTDDWKTKTEKLQELSKAMRALPIVPDPSVDELKNTLDKIRDDFFIKKSSHFEDQEKVLLDNLAHKIEICEKAESLATSKDWKATTEAYNVMNDEWKAIGPIPRHRNEELWLRFNQAKDVFFAAKKENFSNIKEQQEEAYKVKLVLIEKAEALKDSRDWKKTSDEYAQLLEEWKKTGRVSNEMNDDVWNKFNESRNHFFQAKEAYYSSIKLNLDDNYAKKMAIVTRTEELANSEITDWEGATAEILEMNDDWRKIGRIPKEHGDEPWERFLKAKQTFFDKKDEDRAKRRSEGSKNLDDKIRRNRSYYNKLKRELELEVEVLEDFQDRLKNLGAGVRSFETKERYESIVADAEKKVAFLQNKLNDVKNNLDADEKEMRFINRPFVKKDGKTSAEGGSDTPAEPRPERSERRPQSNFKSERPRGGGNYSSAPSGNTQTALGAALAAIGMKVNEEAPKEEKVAKKVPTENKAKEEIIQKDAEAPKVEQTETIAESTSSVNAVEPVVEEVSTNETETSVENTSTATPIEPTVEEVSTNETETPVENISTTITVEPVVEEASTKELVAPETEATTTPQVETSQETSNKNDGIEIINENPTELNS